MIKRGTPPAPIATGYFNGPPAWQTQRGAFRHIKLRRHDLVMPKSHPGDEFLRRLDRELDRKFRIAHPTIQIELGNAGACKLAPERIV